MSQNDVMKTEDSDAVDVAAYCDRIGYRGAAEPTVETVHPDSFFVTGLTAALVADDARWNLRGRHLAIHRAGNTERIRFDTAADVLDALAGRFGIDLADVGDRADVEARVTEVLDS
jgi:arylamine N-acetyltransferase